MTTPISQLEQWMPGMKSVRADDMNAIIAWIQKNNLDISHDGTRVAYSGPDGRWGSTTRSIDEEWIGQIVTNGPEDEEDYTDARYWVRRGRVINRVGGEPTPRLKVDPETFDISDTRFRWITATNLSELLTDSHKLAADTWVRVQRAFDLSAPRQRRYYFTSGEIARGQVLLAEVVESIKPGDITIVANIIDDPFGKANPGITIQTLRHPPTATLDHTVPFIQVGDRIPVNLMRGRLIQPERMLVPGEQRDRAEERTDREQGPQPQELEWWSLYGFIQIQICDTEPEDVSTIPPPGTSGRPPSTSPRPPPQQRDRVAERQARNEDDFS